MLTLPKELARIPVREDLKSQLNERYSAYRSGMELVREAHDRAQVMFDIHRQTFPDDFNFQSFLNEQPWYHESLSVKNQALVAFENAMGRAYGKMWEKFAHEVL